MNRINHPLRASRRIKFRIVQKPVRKCRRNRIVENLFILCAPVIFGHCGNREEPAVRLRKFIRHPVAVRIHIIIRDCFRTLGSRHCTVHGYNIPVRNIRVCIDYLMNLLHAPSLAALSVTVDIIRTRLNRAVILPIPLKHEKQVSFHCKYIFFTSPARIPYPRIGNIVSDISLRDCARSQSAVTLPYENIAFLMENPVTFIYGYGIYRHHRLQKCHSHQDDCHDCAPHPVLSLP